MRHLCSFVDLITSCICSPTHFLARLFNWAMDSHAQGWQNVMLTVYFRSILFVVFIAEFLLIIFRNFELGCLWTVFLISLTINRQYFGAGNDSISVWRTVWKMAQTSILVGSVGSYFSSRNSYFFSSNFLVKLYHIYNFWRLQWWWECFQVRSLNLKFCCCATSQMMVNSWFLFTTCKCVKLYLWQTRISGLWMNDFMECRPKLSVCFARA